MLWYVNIAATAALLALLLWHSKKVLYRVVGSGFRKILRRLIENEGRNLGDLLYCFSGVIFAGFCLDALLVSRDWFAYFFTAIGLWTHLVLGALTWHRAEVSETTLKLIELCLGLHVAISLTLLLNDRMDGWPLSVFPLGAAGVLLWHERQKSTRHINHVR